MTTLPAFVIGQKVEYFSHTMNGWVLSYVKGPNPDGTYRLNTKKSADPRLIRGLLCSTVAESETLTAPNLKPNLGVRTKPTSTSAIAPQLAVITSRHHVVPGPFQVTLKSIFRAAHSQGFDLSLYKAELLSQLQLPTTYNISRMVGFSGGQNESIWFVGSGSTRTFCFKVVKSGRKFPSVPSEKENYVEILSRYPAIMDDASLTFPQKVFCVSSFDVIAMPVAKGDRMAEVISRIVSKNDEERLRSVFLAVGRQLRIFHKTYAGTQHGDLQSSNIFIEMGTDVGVSFIDLGGMGLTGSLGKRDFEYFLESITLLAKTYGPDFARTATASFIDGYVNYTH